MKKYKHKSYNVVITHKQLKIIENALNLFSRIGMGQLEVVADLISNLTYDKNKITPYDIREKWTDSMKKDLYGFDSNASYGIACKEVPDDCKIAYDMQKSIQKVIATVEEHHKFSVWHHGNILHLGSEPILKIEE